MKNIIITIVVVALVGVGVYFVTNGSSKTPVDQNLITDDTTQATTTQTVVKTNPGEEVIGKSVQGRDISAYHYGTGSKELLFVAGVHGGYEWNTSLVAYQLMDYLKTNPSVIPSNIKVTVIPVLNPDGLKKIVGTTTANFTVADVASDTVSGRFNSNNVDLNRNFDCAWQASAVWQNKTVNAGSSAFSEPESKAIQAYVLKDKPTAVVAWYSAAGGVYASNCYDGVLPDTEKMLRTYANASGYPAFDNFDFYETTGDMTNWLSKNSIPAISVLLTDHTNTEWSKNQAGVKALIKYFSNK